VVVKQRAGVPLPRNSGLLRQWGVGILWVRGLLFDSERDGVLGVFPGDFQRSAATAGIHLHGDNEAIDGFGEIVFFKIHAAEVLLFVVIDSGLANLFVDDQLGRAVFDGEHVERHGGVGGNGDIAELQRGLGDQEGRLIGTQAPDLVPRHEAAPDFPHLAGRTLDCRAAVVDGRALHIGVRVGALGEDCKFFRRARGRGGSARGIHLGKGSAADRAGGSNQEQRWRVAQARRDRGAGYA
jgi:hypothetical protein